MPGTPYDRNDTKHITEGNYGEVLHKQAVFSDHSAGSMPVFLRYVILDVISDPSVLDKTKLSYYENELGVSNIAYASVAPRNSIIARRVLSPGSSASDKVMVLYPFFPPHLSLPAKPGEHVWVMFENPTASGHELGYWMCRIVHPFFVEDVNYTHADRQFDASFLPGLTDVFEGSDEPVYEFPNGAVDVKDGNRYVIANTISLAADKKIDTAYSDLLSNSDASKMTTYESVPRYRKRPADIALEGSNNTLIVLGTDRTGPVAEYDEKPEQGKVPKPVSDDVLEAAGAIDLVAGRGQTPETGGKPVENKPLGKKELGKDKKNLQEREGDVDFKNDRSRVLIAQKTKPDKNFKIDSIIKAHVKNKPIEDKDGEGAIVIKTDKLRFIARHDVVFMVTGATEVDENGSVKDPEPDPKKCSMIIMKTNGDVIFVPSETGLLRFGGEDANLVPLCTDGGGAVTPNMPGPVPKLPPIIDTMGGAQGAAGGLNGAFPTKVVFK